MGDATMAQHLAPQIAGLTVRADVNEAGGSLEETVRAMLAAIGEGCGSPRGTILAPYPIDITRNSTIRGAHPRYPREKRSQTTRTSLITLDTL